MGLKIDTNSLALKLKEDERESLKICRRCKAILYHVPISFQCVHMYVNGIWENGKNGDYLLSCMQMIWCHVLNKIEVKMVRVIIGHLVKVF